MNEKLQQALAEMINKGVSAIEQAGTFAMDELPDVVSQLLMYEFAYSLLWFSVSVVFMLALYPITRSGMRSVLACENAEDEDYGRLMYARALFCFGGAILGGILSVVTILTNHTWIKIWLAPKVWLIEYAARLVK